MDQTQPETLLAKVTSLSVRPIRMIEKGTMHEDRVSTLIQQELGEVQSFGQ